MICRGFFKIHGGGLNVLLLVKKLFYVVKLIKLVKSFLKD